jgi:membrane-associated protein
MHPLVLGVLGLDPKNLIATFGLVGILTIVFAESGLLVGFFLPGDSLLFTAGLLTQPNEFFHFDVPIAVLAVGCAVAAVAGDQTGYLIGNRAGPRIFNRPESRLFKHENVERAEDFFERHGSKAIVMARFVPIVRTFVPVVAGVSNMEYRRFVTYNVIGGTAWGAGFPVLGWALGNRFPGLTDRIELLAVAIVAISLVPIAVEVVRHRRRAATAADPAGAEPAVEKVP